MTNTFICSANYSLSVKLFNDIHSNDHKGAQAYYKLIDDSLFAIKSLLMK